MTSATAYHDFAAAMNGSDVSGFNDSSLVLLEEEEDLYYGGEEGAWGEGGRGETLALVAVYVPVMVVAVAGNVVVLAVVLLDRRMRRSAPNFFLCNLALADLLGGGCPLVSTKEKHQRNTEIESPMEGCLVTSRKGKSRWTTGEAKAEGSHKGELRTPNTSSVDRRSGELSPFTRGPPTPSVWIEGLVNCPPSPEDPQHLQCGQKRTPNTSSVDRRSGELSPFTRGPPTPPVWIEGLVNCPPSPEDP
ncbi:hypothetical protein ACOMHN_050482 [Nucella lapillus]